MIFGSGRRLNLGGSNPLLPLTVFIDIGWYAAYYGYMNPADVKTTLMAYALDQGASAVGACRVDTLIEQFHPEIQYVARRLTTAISFGLAVQQSVLDTLTNGPNDIYKSHYRTINSRLDQIGLMLAETIARMGYQAMNIPASQLLGPSPKHGNHAHLNHREVAYRAGLGWRGKNNLLVNSRFAGRLRLATVLTDLDLPPDPIMNGECGSCRACAAKCPADAIGGETEDFRLDKCREQVLRFSHENNYGQLICGLCLDCCPGGRKNA